MLQIAQGTRGWEVRQTKDLVSSVVLSVVALVITLVVRAVLRGVAPLAGVIQFGVELAAAAAFPFP
jgi:VIT1/CCC1 family predicted Fe2+/Mn2+ transporter